MNGTQLLITIGYSVLVIASIVVALRVIRSTHPDEQEREFDEAAYVKRETGWAWIVVVGLIVLLGLTIFSIPYGNDSEAKVTQRVQVTGLQFAWVMRPSSVRAGEPVEFRLRSNDVNHGFGLYRGSRLEVQVQVMPGREQRLVHTFDEPGTYRVLCMEFCGLSHHLMTSQLVVK